MIVGRLPINLIKMDTEDFLNRVVGPTGKINSRTLNQKYWESRGLLHVWNTFLESTKSFESYTISDRVFFLQYGISKPRPCEVCGNPCMVTRDNRKHYSNWCSTACSKKSPSRASKISKTKRSSDSSLSNQKRQQTMLQKYGVEYNSQRPEIKPILTAPRGLTPDEWVVDDSQIKDLYINQGKTSSEIAELYGVTYYTILHWLRRHNIPIRHRINVSAAEKQIADWIEAKGYTILRNIKIDHLELDIYIPERNLGIEINGDHWHSDEHKDKFYHQEKFRICQSKNIRLLQFRAEDIDERLSLVQSMINHALGESTLSIGARQCSVEIVNQEIASSFFANNHISSFSSPKGINIGLLFNNRLVCCMSFVRPRYTKGVQWEIGRFASLQNHRVVGAASRLLAFFKKMHPNETIGTYSDNRYGSGKVYEHIGFKHAHDTEPGYVWVDGNGKILNRYQTQKSKLQYLLKDKFEETKSESENMRNSGWNRLYDAGHSWWICE